MDPATAIVASQALRGLTQVAQEATAPSKPEDAKTEGSGNNEFDNMLRSILPESSGNKVDEEALFAALLEERITTLKGEDAGAEFRSLFEQHKSAHTRSDGYINVEEAAYGALAEFQEQGGLSAEEAGKIRKHAFRAAQLDDNHEALFDGRGSENDPTVAVANMESALLSARAMLEQLESGEISADEPPSKTEGDTGLGESGGTTETTSETVSPEGNTIDGAQGFLWKPEAEHSKQLVVLLPQNLAMDVESLLLRDKDGNEVERGTSSGYANGGREHFRFNKAGSEYPENITVEVTLKSGEIVKYDIPNPAERYD